MNKKELIKIVSKVTHMTATDVELVLTSALEVIMISISKKEVVRLIGFGSFHFYEKKVACSGKEKSVEEVLRKQTVKFSPGKFFKEALSSSH